MDCFGTYFTHVQSCDNVRVQSATAIYGMDYFGTYFTHAPTCDNVRVQSATAWTASVHKESCDNVRVQSATAWTASVHTLHMPKAVITFVFKVLRHGLLRYILMMMMMTIMIMRMQMTMIILMIMIVIFTTQLRHKNAHRNQWKYVIGSSPAGETAIYTHFDMSTIVCF